MQIILDIYSDYSKLLISHLQKIPNLQHIVIENKNDTEIILLAIDMAYFFIEASPRKVFYSNDFICHEKYKKVLLQLILKIENGENIASYQRMYKETPDYCWYDWGIYHFHLGEIINNKVTRTRELLYAYVDNQSVYCLGIDNHKKFTDPDLFKSLHKNFPHLIKNKKLNGILPSKSSIIENDIKLARKGGLSLLYPMEDGTVYAPIKGGYSVNGASTIGVLQLNKLKREFKNVETNLQDIVSPKSPQYYKLKDFEPIMNLSLIDCDEEFFDFREENTGQILRVNTQKTIAGNLFITLKEKHNGVTSA